MEDLDDIHPDLLAYSNLLKSVTWSDPAKKEAALRRLGVAILGSSHIDFVDFLGRFTEQLVKRCVVVQLKDCHDANHTNLDIQKRCLDSITECEERGSAGVIMGARRVLADAAVRGVRGISDYQLKLCRRIAEIRSCSVGASIAHGSGRERYVKKTVDNLITLQKQLVYPASSDKDRITISEASIHALELCGTRGSKLVNLVG